MLASKPGSHKPILTISLCIYSAGCALLLPRAAGQPLSKSFGDGAADPCGEWDSQTNKLHPQFAEQLQRYGIAWDGDHVFLTKRFGGECAFRLKLGGYWGRMIASQDQSREDTL